MDKGAKEMATSREILFPVRVRAIFTKLVSFKILHSFFDPTSDSPDAKINPKRGIFEEIPAKIYVIDFIVHSKIHLNNFVL
jgi:hypothetical protein